MSIELPTYYSQNFNGMGAPYVSYDLRISPKRIISNLNEKILKLHPRRELIITISMIALSILTIVVTCLTSMSFVPAVVAITATAYQIWEQSSSLNKCEKIKEKIRQELPAVREFFFLDCTSSNIDLSLDEFSRIRKYLDEISVATESICLKVRTESHYKISGGEISFWSAHPLKLDLISRKDNKQLVIEKYKPWIDLLLAIDSLISLSENAKMQIGQAVGYMIHKPYGLFGNLELSLQEHLKTRNIYYVPEDLKNETPHIAVRNEENGEITTYHTAEDFQAYLSAKNLISQSVVA